MTVQMPFANPKGIVSSSPRLRGTSYLGYAFERKNNANGVVAGLYEARIDARHNRVAVGGSLLDGYPG